MKVAPNKRVRPGGKDLDLFFPAVHREQNLGPHGFADPVALHGQDALRPAGQSVAVFQQFLHIVGDLEKPLFQFPEDHRLVAAPAAALFHLLVGQHRLAVLAPVHRGFLLIGQPRLNISMKTNCSQR